MISAAICWASAALPPLPMIRSLLPARSAATMTAAIVRAVASSAASRVARARPASDCSKCAAIGSLGSCLDSWLKAHRQKLQLLSLVMTAPNQRKLAISGRCAGRGLFQHAFGDSRHVRGGNVPHAAMVVDPADGAVTGLARQRGFGLHRRRK